jgi:type II secretory pathway pseudopilin PulG
MRAVLTIVLLAALAGPAASQGLRVPQSGRAENQVQDLNRSMQQQQQQLRNQQQGQFELNQLRQDLNRSQNFPSITGPGVSRGCPPGAVRC